MTIEVLRDPGAFEPLRAEWDEFLQASLARSPFLTGEWLTPWWTHLPARRRLALVLVRHEGRLIAAAPLRSAPIARRLLPCLGAFERFSGAMKAVTRAESSIAASRPIGAVKGSGTRTRREAPSARPELE